MRLHPSIIERTTFGRPPLQPLDNGQRLAQFRSKLDTARPTFNHFFPGGRSAAINQRGRRQ